MKKLWPVFSFVMAGVAVSSLLGLMAALSRIEKVSAEWERERSFNVRRERRLHFMEAPKEVNCEAVATAWHYEGTAPSVIASLLSCENGPEDNESGSVDKSDFVTQLPFERRSAVEGTRTLNRQAWEWFTRTPEGRRAMKKMLEYAAPDYTNLSKPEQLAWVQNMMTLEEKFRFSLKVDGRMEVRPLVHLMKTPTPDYGVLAIKAPAPAKRVHSRRKAK